MICFVFVAGWILRGLDKFFEKCFMLHKLEKQWILL